MSKKNPPGDKESLLGSIRRTSDRVKRWLRSPSRPPSSQSTSNAGDQHLRSPSAVDAAANTSNNSPHLLAPSALGTHIRVASAPDLTSGANSPPGTTDSHVVQQDTTHEEYMGPAWLGLKTALGGLHETAKLFPSLHSAIGSFLSGFDHFQAAAKNRQDYDQLASELETLVALLDQHLRKSESTTLSDCVINVVKSLENEMEKASKKTKQSTAAGVIRAREDEDALTESYQRISSIFRRLEARVDASLSTWSVVNEHLARTRLEGTRPAELAAFNAALPADIVRRACTENTRTTILSSLDKWSYDPSLAKVYWMNGMAGTGKTTISCSLCKALAERKQLGASFFCTRTLPECRDARRIIPTLAYQLAQYSRPFKSALCEVLEIDADVHTHNIQTQFERMLKKPLSAVKDAIPDNVVVVIDALDECDSGTHVRKLLNELFGNASDLPLKFFLTSRPDPGIANPILSQNDDTRAILHLHEIETSLVQADIELYLKEGLSPISPSSSEIQQLAQLAGCLFIYAATAVRYIVPTKSTAFVNSRQRLQTIITGTSQSKKQHAELDALYMTVLKGALDEDLLESDEYERACKIVWTAVSVYEPVAIGTLSEIVEVDAEETRMVLHVLQSVLRVSRDIGLVTTLHASFPDFINSPDRSEQFSRGPMHAQYLATRCFAIMKTGLRFNICQLESSFALDESIHDLDQRITTHIPLSLSYACGYWGDHLTLFNASDELFPLLEEFLTYRLLSWMEVLNLTRPGTLGNAALYRIQQWLLARGSSSYLAKLVSDARIFVADFAQNSVARSTPHIYVSALPFCHKSSLIYLLYRERMKGLTNISGTALESGPGHDVRWSVGTIVDTISVSPIGNLVAFGGRNHDGQGIVGALDYHTGAHSMSVFKGHGKPVTSVAFSPDGGRIASASEDQTARVWDASTGKPSCQPFQGHTSVVSSVAFSPDGVFLVSGSHDTTVRVWIAQTGRAAIKPFEGHFKSVLCVGFSPDGTCVVSGSRDGTIRVWGLQDGSLVAGPFLIDAIGYVCSLSTSPTGSRVAVGFSHGILIWEVQACKPVADFFQGSHDWTVSVAFSSDGSRVASSTGTNGRISIWDARKGKLAGEIDTHTVNVGCVAFSPDGKHVLSSSGDTTISVWPASGSSQTTGAPQGVPGPVRHIAFSVDGSCFASGSDDGSVCVWVTRDGRLIIGPLKGHGAYIMAVAFSPDQSHIVSVARNSSLITWNAQNGSVVSGPIQGPVTGEVKSIAISPDVTRVVSGFESGAICIWGADDGKVVFDSFAGHSEQILSLAFSPDGTRIVSGSKDNTVYVWNARDGTRIAGPFATHTSWVRSASFSPDGLRIASGSDDGTICVHNVEDGEPIASPFKGHNDWIVLVAFCPDGTLIVLGYISGEVRVWNAHSGKQVAGPFTGAFNSVKCVAFSPDGRYIVCCRIDRTIRFIPVFPPYSSTFVPTLDGELKVDESGWLVDEQGQYLLWVPPHICPFFPSGHQPFVIFSNGTIQVDYSGALIGDEWSKCYTG